MLPELLIIFFTLDIIISNAVITINAPIITLNTDSNFPYPNGWFLSSVLFPTLSPIITRKFVIESVNELNPSASNDELKNIFPNIIFIPAKRIFKPNEKNASNTNFFSFFLRIDRFFIR